MWLGSGDNLLPVSKLLTFLCVHTRQRTEQRSKLSNDCYKGSSLILQAPPSWPHQTLITSQTRHLLISSHWQGQDRISTCEFGGDSNIQGGCPHSSVGKESSCSAGDPGSIPGLGRSPGEGKGYPLQYSGLENSMDYTVLVVAESRTRLSDFHFHFQTFSSYSLFDPVHWHQQKNASLPKDVSILTPNIWDYVALLDKREFEGVIKLRLLKWEMMVAHPENPMSSQRSLEEGSRRIRIRKCVIIETLMQATSVSWKRQGPDFRIELLEGTQLCQHLDLSLVRLTLNFWPPEPVRERE